VVAVLPAPHDTAGLVLAAAQGLELDLDEAVGERDVLFHAPRKIAHARLPQHVGRARRGGIGLDRPAMRALAGHAGDPSGGQRSGAIAIEAHDFDRCLVHDWLLVACITGVWEGKAMARRCGRARSARRERVIQ
jgi:hypothetical protein